MKLSVKKIVCLLLTLMQLSVCAFAQAQDAPFNALTAWGISPELAQSCALLQNPDVKQSVNSATVAIDEVAYDGVTAYVHYTLVDEKATEPLAELDEETGLYLLTDEAYDYFADKLIGWNADNITINGQEYGMPLAGGQDYGSENNGEMHCYLSIRLDQTGFKPSDTLELGLPIGNPENADMGMLAVALDTSVYDRIDERTFNTPVTVGDVTVSAVSTQITPAKIYVSAAVKSDADAVIAQREKEQSDFDAANIDIVVDEAWASSSVNLNWSIAVTPVDKDGKAIEGMENSFTGPVATGADQVMFEYILPDTLPEAVYLAVCDDNGVADMSTAVQIL